MLFQKKKFYIAILIIFFVTLLLGFLIFSNTLNFWQLQITDSLYKANRPSSQITIITIDDRTQDDKNGLGNLTTWSRSYFARILENINKYHPKAVAFDLFFRREKDRVGDVEFQKALAETENAFIIYPGNPNTYQEDGYFMQEKEAIDFEKPLSIFLQTKNVVLTLGNALPDGDSVMRRILPLIVSEKNGDYQENLPFAIARVLFNGLPLPQKPRVDPMKYEIDFKNGQKQEIPLENGQMIINYASSFDENAYQRISFLDVFNENYKGIDPRELFQNKIIFIGGTSISFRDSYFTPIDKLYQLPGVEIHANALQTILDQNFLRNMTSVEKIFLLFCICTVAAFIFMFTKIRWSIFFIIASIGLYSVAAPYVFQKGLILDLIHPYLAIVSVFVIIYLYRYLTEFKEKSELRSAFSKYVNPQVVDQIMQHPEKLKLGGEKRIMTVLFTDIANFTTISESLQPESLVALLNEYFEAMSEVILKEGGTLDKFEGDAIMAFFGAPLPIVDHAKRACTAALKMRKRLNLLLKKWETDSFLPGGEKKPKLNFRCGISTGEVIVGNIGSTQRFDYTVMGDIVNLGSRLEGANKKYGTSTMVSEATALEIIDYFETRELDLIRVVGKNQPIRIYEVLNFKGELVPEAIKLLHLYAEGIGLYQERKFNLALEKFNQILDIYPKDEPSKLYKQRCEVLKNYPPKPQWDGVFEMGTK